MKTLNKIEHYRSSGGKLVATALAVVFAIWAPTSTAANFGESLANTFKNGEFDVNFRYRYEWVDQEDNGKKNANASTLRTRLVFRTAKWNDFDVTLNMDDVHTVIASDYNSTRNGKTQYQTVADPKGTSLNIAALTYSGLQNTTIVGGRQRIKRGNDRFIGNVGWRQNEQTYDALSGEFKSERFQVFLAYVDAVNRIFGPKDDVAPPFNAGFGSESILFDAAYTLNKALSVKGYAYLLDLDTKTGDTATEYNASSETIGVRINGAPQIGDNFTLTYVAEYAKQQDYEKSTLDYDADYIRAELGLKWNWLGLNAGYELLGADEDAGVAFQTPLATLHAHNGWADKFLSTPGGGLEDAFIAASAKVGKGTLKLIFHDFSSDVGSVDYGQEIDFLAKWPLGDNYSILGKLAFYDGDTNAPTASLTQDTTKAWLMFTAAF
jgi:hypothetical protein